MVGSKRPPCTAARRGRADDANRSGPASIEPSRFSRDSSESSRKRERSASSRWNSCSAASSAAVRVLGVDQQLDVGAHRAERAALHHDVLVIVSGGRVTTRTDETAGAATYDAATAACFAARAFAAAISAFRARSAL